MIGMGIRVMTMVVMMIMSMISMVMMVMSGTGSDSFNMMMMTLLRKAHFTFKSQHLLPVFAELAIHQVPSFEDFIYTFRKGIQNQWMIIEVGGLDEFNLRMPLGDKIGMIINSLNEDSGEQKIGKNHNPFKT
tara:strand:+ start:315 stop:710 length:396 start_codon:yes stop_codon:yes gene_type:complete